MDKHKFLRAIMICLCGLTMAVAPGMNFQAQLKVLPDAAGSIDALYQIIARTTGAFSSDSLSLAVLSVVFIFLANRFLLRSNMKIHWGEYLLCLFLSGMMLLSQAIQTDNTVRLLYSNGFQIIKSILYMTGMYFIYLVACRGLQEVLQRGTTALLPSKIEQWVGRLNFWKLSIILLLFWLPHIIIKYPGVLMWDTFHQIKQFIGDYTRTSNHPAFGTLIYGIMETLGVAIGNVNISYFVYMLAQVALLIAVLSYSLIVMQRFRVPAWVQIGALFLYAISPCYIGWVTVICKDTTYLTLCIFIGTLLLEFAHDGIGFFSHRRKVVALAISCVILCLTRYNGIMIASVAFFAIGILLIIEKAGSKQVIRFVCFALITVLLSYASNEALLRLLNVNRVFMHDVYSIPLQQTALVAARNYDEIPQDEIAVIDHMADYELIAQRAGSWYADSVKDTYKQSATEADRAAYLKVWFQQLLRYPVDNLDALLIMNSVLFDLQFNRPMYVSLTDNTLTSTVYPYSYNDMTLYNSEEIEPLNSAQRLLTQWYFSFDDIPLIGWFASMGFTANVMLLMIYLLWRNGKKRMLIVFIPSLVTFIGCLFSPVAYLRYALPYMCSLPLWFAAYYAYSRAEMRPSLMADK